MSYTMRFPPELMARLEAHLFPGDSDEHGAVVAASVVTTERGTRFLAHRVFLAPRNRAIRIDGFAEVTNITGGGITQPLSGGGLIVGCRIEESLEISQGRVSHCVVEADKIVAKLPADRRLRLEARREARQSIRMSRRQAPPKVWSPGLLILALAAAMVLAAVLFWPKADQHAQRTPVGTLGVTTPSRC